MLLSCRCFQLEFFGCNLQSQSEDGLGFCFPTPPEGIFGPARAILESVMTTIFGIKNCDTMKRARAWLDAHKVAYSFHDYKVSGIDRPTLEGWTKKVGWEVLLNRAGTTFKKLPDADKEGISEKKALLLMLAQPSMIKRPVLEAKGRLTVGFKPEEYKKLFG
jgi:arsenate reductase